MSWLDGAPNWIERGDFRLDTVSTAVEQRIRTGTWAPMDWASEFYDPRQDSNTLDSNERRQLVYWFKNAPAGVPITQALPWAAANGFQEPDRSNNEGTFGAFLKTAAPYALAVLGVGAAAGAFSGALAGEGAASAAFLEPTAASVSPSTWAAFGNTASTADLYAAATSSAINTSVADYAAAAVAGETVGAGAAFTSGLPLASLSGPASGSFWSSALDSVSSIAKTGKQAADVVRLINAATGQNTIVPKNAPVPAGYAVDRSWSPSTQILPIAIPGQPVQEAAAVSPSTYSDAGMVQSEMSMAPYLLLAAAFFGVVVFFGKRK